MYNFINLFKLFKLAFIIKLLVKNSFNVNFVALSTKEDEPNITVYYIDKYDREGQVNFAYGKRNVDGYAYKVRWTQNTNDHGKKQTNFLTRECQNAYEVIFEVKRANNFVNGIKTTVQDWPCD